MQELLRKQQIYWFRVYDSFSYDSDLPNLTYFFAVGSAFYNVQNVTLYNLPQLSEFVAGGQGFYKTKYLYLLSSILDYWKKDLPHLTYVRFQRFSFSSITSVTLSNIPFVNGTYIDETGMNRFTANILTCDPTSSRLQTCIIQKGCTGSE